jgi:hypothetical protein
MSTTGEITYQSQKLNIPLVVFIVILTWAVSAGVTYGVLSTRIDWLAQRMDSLERQSAQTIQRPEYDTAKQDLDNRLDRIERKIDNISR